jgi:hypothetical protein
VSDEDRDDSDDHAREMRTGRFSAGNKFGGRTAMPPEFRRACREMSTDALAVIEEIMLNALDPNVQLKAAQYVIDRAYGKASQPLTGGDAGDGERPVIEPGALIETMRKIAGL